MDRIESATVSRERAGENQHSSGSEIPHRTPRSSSLRRSAVGNTRSRYNPESEITQECSQMTREVGRSIVRPNKRTVSHTQNARKKPRETPIANQQTESVNLLDAKDSRTLQLLQAAQSVVRHIMDIVSSPMKTKKPPAEPERPVFELIPTRNGEEDERNVFFGSASLYHFIDDTWETTGYGEVKINVDRRGKARLIMRRDITMGLLLNQSIDSDIKLVDSTTKNAVVFTCKIGDRKEHYPQCGILALRFNDDDHGIADNFITAIELHRKGGL